MSQEIDTILNSYHSNTLWEMAQAAGLEVKRGGKKLSKGELLPKLRAEYFTEARIRASFAALTDGEREVLNRLLLRGGSVSTKSFRRELVRAGLAAPAPEPKRSTGRSYYTHTDGVPYDPAAYAGSPHRANSNVFEDIIARLTWRGLVFSRDVSLTSGNMPHKIQFHPARTLYVPDCVRRYLPAPQPISSGLAEWQPERVETGEPLLLLRDLYLYWDFLRRNEVSFIQAGFIGKRWLRAINQILVLPDPRVEEANREDEMGRLYLLRQLLEACDLARRQAGILRPLPENPAQIAEFWRRPLEQQIHACLEAWPKVLSGLSELPQEAQRYSPNVRQAQQTILTVLQSLPTGVWFDPDEIMERVQTQNPDFLFADHSRIEAHRGSYYYSYTYGYSSEDTSKLLARLEQYEVQFVTRCLTGFLYQLGIVELGYSGDQVSGVRLHPPLEAAQEAAESGRLIIQPNFQLLAIGPVKLDVLAWLDLFAERQRADRGAFEYHISRESVYRAQQMGITVAEVLRFLEQHSATELPQNVRRSLEEWAAHHERIVFRTGVSLLQVADAGLLVDLLNGATTGDAIARAITPEVALLKKGRQSELISALVAQGLFPAISGDQPATADKSVLIGEDGLVRPVHAVPSLHLRGRLVRLADEMPDGTWRITPASVRRAGGSRAKVLRLLDELNRLQRGTLSPGLVERIKAWGGYYGQAAVQTLTLIEFRDQAALDELQAHPDLRERLTPFPAGNRALAVVPTEQLETVKEILTRLGVQVKDEVVSARRRR